MKKWIIIPIFILVLTGFFTVNKALSATSNNTDALSTSQPGVPAVHKISFTTSRAIPVSGTILISFPALAVGDSNDHNKPSKSTFQLNGLTNTDVRLIVAGVDMSGHATFSASNPAGAGNKPIVSIGLDSVTAIAAGSDVVIYLGCTAISAGSCSTSHPVILNPSKTAAVGVADIWQIQISTLDASNNVLESGLTDVATDDTVVVRATVEPFLSFIIQGTPDRTAMNTSTTCGIDHAGTITNAGLPTASTQVNLGSLGAGVPNYAAQQMSIISNAVNGYIITATGEGKLTNPGSGATIPNAQGDPVAADSPSPTTLDIKNGGFGVHVCDTKNKVNTVAWGLGTESFANPGPTFPYTLINSSTPPAASGDNAMLLYGAVVSDKTPGGVYKTSITYTATPLF